MKKENECVLSEADWQAVLLKKLAGSLLFHLHKVHGAVFKVANKMIQQASVPIKIEQSPVLMAICLCPGISQQELAEKIGRDKSSVLRTVSALEKLGLVVVKKDEQDKRKKILTTSKTGDFVARQLQSIMEKIEVEIAKAFTIDNATGMIEDLKAAAEKLNVYVIR